MKKPEPPLVSIALPTFNGEQYLAEALDSVLNQSFQDWELIIADDCSKDGTMKLAQKYARGDTRIRVVRNPGRLGLFRNYNQCMASAKGTYIKLFAQDDVLMPNIIEKSVAVLEHAPTVTLVTTNKKELTEKGETVAQPLYNEDKVESGEAVALELLTGFKNFVGEPTTATFRLAAMDGGFDHSYFHLGDTELWIRLLLKGEFCYLYEPLTVFRHHKESASHRNQRGLLFAVDMLRLGKKYTEFLRSHNVSPEQYKKRFVECITSFVGELKRGGLESTDIAAVLESVDNATEDMHRVMQAFAEISFLALTHADDLQRSLTNESKTCIGLDTELNTMKRSVSWRMTKPLRKLGSLIAAK